MKVVLDANVVVSRLLSPYKALGEIIRMADSGDLPEEVTFKKLSIKNYIKNFGIRQLYILFYQQDRLPVVLYL